MFITDLAYLEDASQEIVADVKGGKGGKVGKGGLLNFNIGAIAKKIEDNDGANFVGLNNGIIIGIDEPRDVTLTFS